MWNTKLNKYLILERPTQSVSLCGFLFMSIKHKLNIAQHCSLIFHWKNCEVLILLKLPGQTKFHRIPGPSVLTYLIKYVKSLTHTFWISFISSSSETFLQPLSNFHLISIFFLLTLTGGDFSARGLSDRVGDGERTVGDTDGLRLVWESVSDCDGSGSSMLGVDSLSWMSRLASHCSHLKMESLDSPVINITDCE